MNKVFNHISKLGWHVCLSIFLVSTAYADTTLTNNHASADTKRTILILGDSISAGYGIQREQGWVHLFNQQLNVQEMHWQTVNASISGETTSGALARLPQLLAERQPDMVLIELGGNDGLRGYPVKSMQHNLQTMVDLVKAQGAIAVVMAMRIPPNYGPRYTRAFDTVFAEVAASSASLLIPFFLEEVVLMPGMMQQDGIHPTAEAQSIMAQTVVQALAEVLASP